MSIETLADVDGWQRCSDGDCPIDVNDEQDMEAFEKMGLCKKCLDVYMFGDD